MTKSAVKIDQERVNKDHDALLELIASLERGKPGEMSDRDRIEKLERITKKVARIGLKQEAAYQAIKRFSVRMTVSNAFSRIAMADLALAIRVIQGRKGATQHVLWLQDDLVRWIQFDKDVTDAKDEDEEQRIVDEAIAYIASMQQKIENS